ncbi:MAG: hypothetical protein BWY37_02179 [Firmicutes bacterium ADurb.Bin262]|nr:MAG: hypothetical protein BWY37_02179 [Firmicutes bacterium ADurb.Bin262]
MGVRDAQAHRVLFGSAAARVDERGAVGRDMAEQAVEPENMLAPVDADTAALFADLRQLVGMAEHVARPVDRRQPSAHDVPVVELAVDQVADETLRRGCHLVGLVVEAIRLRAAGGEHLAEGLPVLRVDRIVGMQVVDLRKDGFEAGVDAQLLEHIFDDMNRAQRVHALFLVIGGVKMKIGINVFGTRETVKDHRRGVERTRRPGFAVLRDGDLRLHRARFCGGRHLQAHITAGAGFHLADITVLLVRPALEADMPAGRTGAEGADKRGEDLQRPFLAAGKGRGPHRVSEAQGAGLGDDRVNGTARNGQVDGVADVTRADFEHQQVFAFMEGHRRRVAVGRLALDPAVGVIADEFAVEVQQRAGIFIADDRVAAFGAFDIDRGVIDAVALLGDIQSVDAGVVILRVELQMAAVRIRAEKAETRRTEILVGALEADIGNDGRLAAGTFEVVAIEHLVALVEVLRLERSAGFKHEGAEHHVAVDNTFGRHALLPDKILERFEDDIAFDGARNHFAGKHGKYLR